LEIRNAAGELVFEGSNSIPEPENYNVDQPSIDLTGFSLTEGFYSVTVTVRSPMMREDNPFFPRTDMELAEVRFTDGGTPLTFSGAVAPVVIENTDDDAFISRLDTDSDNGGIGDNVEAQYGQTFIEASGNDADGDGLDDAYDETPNGGADGSIGLVPADTNNDGLADYADDEGGTDTLPVPTINSSLTGGAEGVSGTGVSGTGQPGATIVLSVGGTDLATGPEDITVDDDGTWTATLETPIGGNVTITALQSDAPHAPGETSQATQVTILDYDGDTVRDSLDIDDDNDGILDYNEVETTNLVRHSGVKVGNNGLRFSDDDVSNLITYTGNNLTNVGTNGVFGINERGAGSNLNTARTFTFEKPVSDVELQFQGITTFTRFGRFDVKYSDGTTQEDLTFTVVNTNGRASLNTFNGELTIKGGSTGPANNNIQGLGTVRFTDLNPDLRIESITFEQLSKNSGSGTLSATIRPLIPDVDATIDTDEDGQVDYRDVDADGGGIGDNLEAQYEDTHVGPTGNDTDGDGLDDAYEKGGDYDRFGLDTSTGGTEFNLTAPADGVDILTLGGSDIVLDFSLIEEDLLNDVETVDITGDGDNTLQISLEDLLDLSENSDTLRIDGDAGDQVVATGGFTNSEPSQTIDGVVYDVYALDDATLLIDEEVSVVI
jgi:hypothetical protein